MSEGLVLVGLPGSGKSEVGRCVADRLGRPFIDLDAEIARTSGASPAEHIRRSGEAAFRRLEQAALLDACGVSGAVIATGGGTSLDPLNRWMLAEHGIRVRLDAPVDTLVERLARDPAERPLLGDDPAAGLRRTAARRAAVYAAVDGTVDAASTPDTVAEEIVRLHAASSAVDAAWRPLYDAPFARHHPIGAPTGRLLFGRGVDGRAIEAALGAAVQREPVVVADRRALQAQPQLAAALPPTRRFIVDGGEAAKSFGALERLLAWLSEVEAERRDVLLAAGGGTIGDVGGLAAALHRRGMPLAHVPTTWLAQADSSIGGKVAIDLPNAKNAVGAFWPPTLILADFDLLQTLPAPRRRDGLAECLKAGLIGDSELWRLVEERGAGALAGSDRAAGYAISERAARLKLAIVERDPYEAGERRLLNLGHTLGHALEVESAYRLPHGEAVGLGLLAVAAIAARRGAEAGLAQRIESVLHALGFPLRRRFDRALVRAALGSDKKRERGTQRWLLPIAVGRVEEVTDVSAAELELALDRIWAPA
ncbi:MAG: hypothetical protein M3N29_07165 [Chloroflexota bacterium]|nr:hypothetical protein [Chloroflexota bacterium]